MKFHLNKDERDLIFNSLTKEQKNFLEETIKKKKKDAFSTRLGKLKGEGSIDNEINWELLDYIDNGGVSENTKCLCGRKLRYVYVLTNENTAEVVNLGITHLKEHTNLPDDIVKDITKKMHTVDSELDEILTLYKFKRNMDLTFIEDNRLDERMRQFIKLNLPLLNEDYLLYKKIADEYAAIREKESLLKAKEQQRIEEIKKLSLEYDLDRLTSLTIYRYCRLDSNYAKELSELREKIPRHQSYTQQLFIPDDFDTNLLEDEIKEFMQANLPLLERQVNSVLKSIKLHQASMSDDQFKARLKDYYLMMTNQYGFTKDFSIELLSHLDKFNYKECWQEFLLSFNKPADAQSNQRYFEIYLDVANMNKDKFIHIFAKHKISFTPLMQNKLIELAKIKKELETNQLVANNSAFINTSPDKYLCAFILNELNTKKRISNLALSREAAKHNLNTKNLNATLNFLFKNNVIRKNEAYGMVFEITLIKQNK